ncbi:hypothetical protein BS50DRAFT_250685 [Corynespora cassiicola Philippines]|uniref:Uncharacterized protein n=1 Tax=Corynespora cassiicola Philippines TaxID=1448308 RepID=A0A2T2P3Y3_CORCC|nr:hypothetical protein BS50DRAFT_250685 [Corynespora cassiicola Philippines]
MERRGGGSEGRDGYTSEAEMLNLQQRMMGRRDDGQRLRLWVSKSGKVETDSGLRIADCGFGTWDGPRCRSFLCPGGRNARFPQRGGRQAVGRRRPGSQAATAGARVGSRQAGGSEREGGRAGKWADWKVERSTGGRRQASRLPSLPFSLGAGRHRMARLHPAARTQLNKTAIE